MDSKTLLFLLELRHIAWLNDHINGPFAGDTIYASVIFFRGEMWLSPIRRWKLGR
jgi:hypothetical protein